MKRYRIVYNGRRRYFANLNAAKAFAEAMFRKAGVIVGIEVV